MLTEEITAILKKGRYKPKLQVVDLEPVGNLFKCYLDREPPMTIETLERKFIGTGVDLRCYGWDDRGGFYVVVSPDSSSRL